MSAAQHFFHWTEGGNAITNFGPEQTFVYARAIDEHGDPDLYIGLPTPNGIKTDRALRVRGMLGRCKDLSDFWAVFDRVSAEAEAKGAAS